MNLVEILNIKGEESVALTGGCAGCSSGCAPVNHTVSGTVKEFEEKYGDIAAIVRYELSDDNADAVAERLQELYTNSGERLIITGSNVKFILGKLNPVIAINGRLAANNYVPDAEELKAAVKNDDTIESTLCN